MDLSWKGISILIGALVGVGKLLWDVTKYGFECANDYMSDKASSEVEQERIEAERELENKRIEKEKQTLIYNDLRDRVNGMEENLRRLRSEVDDWKDNYYEIRMEHNNLVTQNSLLRESNRQLQKTVKVLRDYVDQVVERLGEYEDIDPLPDMPDSPINITAINDRVLDNLSDPNIETSASDVFEGEVPNLDQDE